MFISWFLFASKRIQNCQVLQWASLCYAFLTCYIHFFYRLFFYIWCQLVLMYTTEIEWRQTPRALVLVLRPNSVGRLAPRLWNSGLCKMQIYFISQLQLIHRLPITWKLNFFQRNSEWGTRWETLWEAPPSSLWRCWGWIHT
jgi:hypothetical protein